LTPADETAEYGTLDLLSSITERSVRFRNAYPPSYLRTLERAAFMSGQLPLRTGVYDQRSCLSACPDAGRTHGFRYALIGSIVKSHDDNKEHAP
jgi:arylsulfatase A-like enzyme